VLRGLLDHCSRHLKIGGDIITIYPRLALRLCHLFGPDESDARYGPVVPRLTPRLLIQLRRACGIQSSLEHFFELP
jgi:hypothetical protein